MGKNKIRWYLKLSYQIRLYYRYSIKNIIIQYYNYLVSYDVIIRYNFSIGLLKR